MHWGIIFTVPVQAVANNAEMRQGGEQPGYDISGAGLENLWGYEGIMPGIPVMPYGKNKIKKMIITAGMPGFYNTYS
ncbi:MAG: hypothetical protein R6V34_05475 [Bacteroidales bacterium]